MTLRMLAFTLSAAAVAWAAGVGCREKQPCPGGDGMPQVKSEGPGPAADPFPKPPVNDLDLGLAPTTFLEEVDSYYVRILGAPTKDEVRKRPDVVQNAARLIAGDGRTKADAHKALVALGTAAGCYLVPAAKDAARERSLDAYAAEDAAMEVIYEIQDGRLRGEDMKALLRFLAAATGKNLLVERKILDVKRMFDIRNIYPLPALSRVADALELDDELWRGIDTNAGTLELSTRVEYNLNIRGEDVGWLIESLGRVGKVKVHVEEGVTAAVTMRVRAATAEDAITQVAEHAGLKVKSGGGALWIGRN